MVSPNIQDQDTDFSTVAATIKYKKGSQSAQKKKEKGKTKSKRQKSAISTQ